MYLSKADLLKKFPFMAKFENLDWILELTLSRNNESKNIPFIVCFECLNHLVDFLEKTKFISKWEENFSTKARIQQIADLLNYFKELRLEEMTAKNNQSSSSPKSSSSDS